MLDTEPNDTPETSGTPGVVNSGISDNSTDNDNSTKDDTATTPAPRRRRRAASRPAGPPSVPSVEAAPVPAAVTPEVPAPSDEEEPEAEEAVVAESAPEPEPEPEAPRRARRTRKRVTAPVTDTAEVASAPVEAAEPAPVAAEPEPEPEEAPRRVRRTRKRAAVAPEATPAASDEVVPEAAPAPVRTEPVQAEPAQPEVEAEPEEAPRRTRRTRKRAVPAAEAIEETPAAEAEAVAEPEPEPEAAPEPRTRAGRKTPPPVFQPLFQAPQAAVFAEPKRTAEPTPTPAAGPAPAVAEPETRTEPDEPRGRRRRRRALPVDEVHTAAGAEPQDSRYQDEQERHPGRTVVTTEQAEQTEPEETEGAEAHEDETEGERPTRRRRRGGRRRRGRGDDGAEDSSDEDGEQQAEGVGDGPDDDEDVDEPGDPGATTSSRRRRRRRRRDGAAEESPAEPQDDPERTVVKVREPRKREALSESPTDEVQGVKGSTRLEAKKQRRREGREQGRRRVPIITESEFLARREAVERVMVVRQNGERTQIGVLEDDVLVEHYVNKEQATSYVGNVYLGKVQNVLPSMEAAFVDIGKGRNAVLYAGEVNFEAAGFSGPRRIEAVLKPGQSVLVQVTKDPIGHKGARLTSQVSLPGRYLVYVPEGTMTGISRKLPDTERARLKTILKKIVPENAGVIVRTAAEGATEEDLTRDVTRLQAQWEEIKKKSKMITTSSPSLLYGEPDMTVRVIRDIFNEDFSKLIVSGDEAWGVVHDYVGHVAPDLAPRLSRWTSEVDVFATYRIDEQLMKALDRKVWLPSGGSLVIDRTEAMVVVDVNTGKFTGQGGNLEETVTRNNLEAAEEIVRQLRLRDLGGIIVVDFIDMVLEGNRDLVLRRLMECLGRDRTKHQVAEVTSLGLVQMTRKRVGQGLLEAFSENCERCNGRGVIVHMDAPETKGHGNGGHLHGGNGNGSPAGSGRRKRNKGNADKNGSGPITEIVETDEVDLDGPELEDIAADTELPEVAELGSVEPVEVAEAIEAAETAEVAVEPEPAPPVEAEPVEAEVVAEAPAEEAPVAEAPAVEVEETEPAEAVEETPAPAKRVRKAAAKKTVAKKAAAKTTPAKKTAAAKTPRKSAKKVAAEAAEAAAASEAPAEQPIVEPTPEPAAKPAKTSTRAKKAAVKAQAAAEAPTEAEAEPAKPAKAAAKPRKTSRRATRPAGPPEGAVDGAEPVSATSGS
ncbi:Rne/Rng family ribonuclease [Embleya sp. NPDC005971]|uniref:Rne/Rng family ribonuclease n=1 Tax=Embleya sp. NPDC005971 TaxID=3156724 RepID=UPI0034073D79